MFDFLGSLGYDPTKDLRPFPAGLTNLGTTCYANKYTLVFSHMLSFLMVLLLKPFML